MWRSSSMGRAQVYVHYLGMVAPLPLPVLRHLQYAMYAMEVELSRMPFVEPIETVFSLPSSSGVGVLPAAPADILFDAACVPAADGTFVWAIAAQKGAKQLTIYTTPEQLYHFVPYICTVSAPLLYLRVITDPFWKQHLSAARGVPAESADFWMLCVVQASASSWQAIAFNWEVPTSGAVLLNVDGGRPILPTDAFSINGNAIAVAFVSGSTLRIGRYEVGGLVAEPQIAIADVTGALPASVSDMYWDHEQLFVSSRACDSLWTVQDNALVAMHFQSDADYSPPRRFAVPPFALLRGIRIESAAHERPGGASLMAVLAHDDARDAYEVRLYDTGICVGIAALSKEELAILASARGMTLLSLSAPNTCVLAYMDKLNAVRIALLTSSVKWAVDTAGFRYSTSE